MHEFGFELTGGVPVIIRDGAREILDFNGMHRGYFPECTFTAAKWTGGLFYLAGLDEKGAVHLFSSLRGGVWEERNVKVLSGDGAGQVPNSSVIEILHDPGENQVFLVCRMGQLVTLPDCPKCVKIKNVRDTEVSGAKIENGYIEIYFADGERRSVSVKMAAQYRVSETFAMEMVKKGAVIVDLRMRAEFSIKHMQGAVNVEYSGAEEWLKKQPKDGAYIFICRTGVQSDEMAFFARSEGFERSFSLGGMLDMARVK